jgi:DNA-binding GntR family transcriptional regulator
LVVELEIGQTVSARTAEAIRQRILSLTPGYAPGQRLLPEVLAESLGVSITPVREALHLLRNEGLVTFLPRRGARVVSMSLEEIRDLTSVRGGIEALAVKLRGENYSAEEVAELNTCIDICERAVELQDVRAYRLNDTQIHRLIVMGSRSPTLVDVYEQLHKRAQILELYFTDNWASYRQSLDEHREIVALLATAPRKVVEAAVWTHWQHSRARIATRFSRLSEPSDGNPNTTPTGVDPGGEISGGPG